MGNKSSKASSGRSSPNSLHPQEKRKLTRFLQEKKETAKFTSVEVKRLWAEILTPDLLDSYHDFLFEPKSGHKNEIGLNDFISIYVSIIRGGPDEKTKVIKNIIGSKNNHEGKEVLSYHKLCKYLSDLMESYFVGLQHKNDICFKSWTQIKNVQDGQRTVIEEVMKGVCNDLQRTDDDVRVDLFVKWIHQSVLVNLLHSYVLGSMYNLSPELESNMVPLAEFSMKRISNRMVLLLDVPQVVYLNSFLQTANKELWRLLYSIDIHGQSFSKFVACIVNQGPILVVVHSDSNHLFGGFISTNVALSPKWIGSETSFVFSLRPHVDVYPATGYNDHYAYLNSQQSTLPNGLGMGGQYGYWGLWIDSLFGEGECSESCTTFRNYKMLDAKKKFRIKGLEVWAVGEPPPSDEDLGVRSSTRDGRSALDRDPTKNQIMEMAGREMHSKNLR